jgi:uncharacterized protein YcbK (DUF882 family)
VHSRLARVLTCLGVLACTAGALAHPPPHAKRTVASVGRAQSAAAIAYMAGKQAAVGYHAPSDRPVPRDQGGRPMLALASINRGESLAVPAIDDDGGFASEDLDRAAHLLRAASGEEYPVDPRTLSLVYRIETHFAVPEIRVVSAYRVPRPGSRSNHGKGRAVDLIVPGVADEEVARFVRNVGFVGVGVYPASQFVHVDIRPRSYFWVDYSGPHMRSRERGILGDVAAQSDAAALARGQTAVEPFTVATDLDGILKARGMATVAPESGEEDDDDEN